MNKSDEINELATAMALAQGEIQNAHKNATNPHFRNNYADLAEVLNTIRPVMARHGISISQFPAFADDIASVETIVMHKSGQWIANVSSTPLAGKKDAQAIGSATTYLRRYSLAAIAGVAQEDDDGEGAANRDTRQRAAPKSPAQNLERLSESQVAELSQLIEEVGADRAGFLKWMKVSDLTEIPSGEFGRAKKALKAKQEAA